MYAILETGGFQFTVKEEDKVKIPKLSEPNQKKVIFDKILFISGEKSFIGTPYIKDAKVEAEVVTSGKGEKITVFKKKKRVIYRRPKGHR
ncbi:MAG: 50S ribosomal protein L21, partial [Candidatus Zixiibacteriota bacterium]